MYRAGPCVHLVQVHNRLDNHHEGLLGELVTNESLYLALAEDKSGSLDD